MKLKFISRGKYLGLILLRLIDLLFFFLFFFYFLYSMHFCIVNKTSIDVSCLFFWRRVSPNNSSKRRSTGSKPGRRGDKQSEESTRSCHRGQVVTSQTTLVSVSMRRQTINKRNICHISFL